MRLAVVLALSIAAGPATAQTIERGTRHEGGSRWGGFGYFVLGYQGHDTAKMDAALEAAGFPRSASTAFDLGGGGYFRLDRVLVGGTGEWLLGGVSTSGGQRTEVRGGYGLFELGWAALDRENFWLYPLVGVGIGGMSYRVSDATPTSFAAALAAPHHDATVDTGGLLLEAGVGADLFHFTAQEGGAGGPMIGLRAGWMFQPTSAGWSVNEHDVSGGPDARLGGPFVRLVLGGGGFDWK